MNGMQTDGGASYESYTGDEKWSQNVLKLTRSAAARPTHRVARKYKHSKQQNALILSQRHLILVA